MGVPRHVSFYYLFTNNSYCTVRFECQMNISQSQSQSQSRSESPLSCGLTRFLHPRCFFVSAVFSNLSSFILNMCPNFTRLLTMYHETKNSTCRQRTGARRRRTHFPFKLSSYALTGGREWKYLLSSTKWRANN